MRDYGLKTYAGLSADDPENSRNFDKVFSVVLSVFGKEGLVGRSVIDQLHPHQHRFYSIDDELEKLHWLDQARLCVVHRVPVEHVKNGVVLRQVNLPQKPDFEMYRTVVQYGLPEGGFGGVIYETPPNFNKSGRASDFLTFSNKIYISEETDTYLLFLNYSVSSNYSSHAGVKLNIYDSSGAKVAASTIDVPPLDFSCVNVKGLCPFDATGRIFNFVGSAAGSSLIPLSVNVTNKNGGVSVEHSHPPQAYIMADWKCVTSIKNRAAIYNSGH